MRLLLLSETSHVRIYHDTWNDWLFVDWMNELTLPSVQEGCLALAQAYIQRSYARVLNSNAQVSHVGYDVATWLVTEFLPGLSPAGVEQVAWVWGPTLTGRQLVTEIASRLPVLALAIFSDMEEAVTWLQQQPTSYATGCFPAARSQADQRYLTCLFNDFAHSLQVLA